MQVKNNLPAIIFFAILNATLNTAARMAELADALG